MSLIRASIVALALGGATPLAGTSAPSMHELANAFLATLTPTMRNDSQRTLTDAERTNWHYIPKDRPGVTWKQMDSRQREAATNLLRAALSRPGYATVEAIRALETELRALEGGNPTRDPDLYHFMVFGTPSARGAWGWRYEGHHLSLNYTFKDGRLVSSTPQFLGSNPADTKGGVRVLAPFEDVARELARSLDASQRAEGVVATDAPADIVTSNQRKAAIQENRGLPYSRMNAMQKRLLLDLVEHYVAIQADEERKRRMGLVRDSGYDSIRFAWMGSIEKHNGHYYRVQGKRFLIEYDNTQNNANHIHSVWRDFDGDFGEDVLAEHYAAGHHHGHRHDAD